MSATAAVLGPKRHANSAFQVEARIQTAIQSLAEFDGPILIAGEPGVGQRDLAAQIHALSARSAESFMEIAASECDLSQLTFALAGRGTIYMDEIGDLSRELQDWLAEHYFSTRNPQCRLLCGTTRELLEEIKAQQMSEDFFHLISAITVRISPLRLRRSEILPIADELLVKYSRQFERPLPKLGNEIAAFLLEHPWPGNLKEFETAIKTFVIIDDPSVSLAALKAATASGKAAPSGRSRSLKAATRAASIEVERRLIAEVLLATGGNRKRAADELGISYKALLYKLKQAGSDPRHPAGGNGIG